MKINEFGDKRVLVANWNLDVVCEPTHGAIFVGCGAKLNILLTDIYMVKQTTSTMITIAYNCKCPVCGVEIMLNHKDVPKDIEIPEKVQWLKGAREGLVFKLFELADTDDDYKRILKDCTGMGISREFVEELGITIP